MSYESKLYVVEKTNVLEDGKRYARIIAMFDMEKFTYLSDILRTYPETDCFIYADDGETQVLEDYYGKPLTEASVNSVIEILDDSIISVIEILDDSIIKECHAYDVRVWAALEYLKIIDTMGRENIVVLHYGY